VGERLLGVRQRQEVVRVVPADAGPAEVIGDPGRVSGSVEPIDSDTPCITIG